MHKNDWVDDAVQGLPALVTTEEAVQVLRTTRRNLYRWLATGKIPSVKHGFGGSSRVLIPKPALVKYLRSIAGADSGG